jgi:hypothetical protein
MRAKPAVATGHPAELVIRKALAKWKRDQAKLGAHAAILNVRAMAVDRTTISVRF